ncbi:hypothetical protein BD626DRAFT_525143 [Schizophyllum amplum]|uniref:CCR4-NOT transcription complex subunit 11 n=1 Tax=Schizophyllum amplum TaxID=97359 RepID=A0A550BSM4_9AGAR|nr:hypothetical protein BD626DRAFT_525143 [Auriculariopsis ampla]
MARFQVALDVLLPLLEQQPPAEPAQRILVAFILYSLYAPHPISINPFKSALYVTFRRERDNACALFGPQVVSQDEQLVWVLWKILKGDGNDIGPYSPSTLARSPLPEQLRAYNLNLDENQYIHMHDIDGYIYASGPARQAKEERPPWYDEWMADPDDAQRNCDVGRALKLVVAARERVLTLSEQRDLTREISSVVAAGVLTSSDIAPLVSNNPVVAHPLLVAMLARNQTTGNKGADPNNAVDANNTVASTNNHNLPAPILGVIAQLAPRLPTLDLMGRLLRDTTPTPNGTVADVVRVEVLGRFVHEAINYLDGVEREATGDDTHAQGVQHVSVWLFIWGGEVCE